MKPVIINTVFLLIITGLVIGISFVDGFFYYGFVLLVLFLAVIVWGAADIRLNLFTRSVNSIADKKNIVLTFDDGPNEKFTSAILDILNKNNVKASFFCIGKHIATHHSLTERIHKEGHDLFNHSYYHDFGFDMKGSTGMAEEIRKTNKEIEAVTGGSNIYFRPPYGVTNPNLAHAISLTGMRSVGWSIRSFDTREKSAERLLNRIKNKIKGGDIILLHDHGCGTIEMLPALIKFITESGFVIKKISDCKL